jgi:hypothetical protein
MALEGADDALNDDFPITIFRNPDCGTSRNTLALIEAVGCGYRNHRRAPRKCPIS